MISKLAIQEVPCNDCHVLRLADNSYYNPSVPVENAIIEITTPGAIYPVVKKVEPYFSITFNSGTLKIVPAKEAADLVHLPDGIYTIKYSIKPNTQIFVEYALLQNCRQRQRYYSALCGLFSSKCDISKREFDARQKDLIWIKELIDTAKWKVEECGEEAQGLELYNQANALLNNYNDCSCK